MKFLAPLFLLTLLGCYPDPSQDKLVENMLVETTYDQNTAYDFYSTFTLTLDTIGFLSSASRDTLVIGPLPQAVTTSIKANMINAGYKFLDKNQNPDLGLAATFVQNYDVFQSVYYPSYYTGYYGYGYGGYYGSPIISTYSSTTNFLVINLIDLKNRDAQGRLKVIWKAQIGELDTSNTNTLTKLSEAITQAFKQSTYLCKPCE